MAVGRHIQTFWDEIFKSNCELILSAGVDLPQNIIWSMKSSGYLLVSQKLQMRG